MFKIMTYYYCITIVDIQMFYIFAMTKYIDIFYVIYATYYSFVDVNLV